MSNADTLPEPILELIDAATDVVDTWEQGDLAAAVNWLDHALSSAKSWLEEPPLQTGIAGMLAEAAPPPIPPRRFQDALHIVDPGACNPSGIAYAIASACQEARDEGVSTVTDPAIRLMVTQLAWVCSGNSDIADYDVLLKACRERVEAAANLPATVEASHEPG